MKRPAAASPKGRPIKIKREAVITAAAATAASAVALAGTSAPSEPGENDAALAAAAAGSSMVPPLPKLPKPPQQLTQLQLEKEILKLCAAGKDRLDKKMAPGVTTKAVPAREDGFPRQWVRKEGGKKGVDRGGALWFLPPEKKRNEERRMLFLHGGAYVQWAPQDAPYKSLCSRLALLCEVCVFAVDYRKAPEHLFPAAYDDGVEALEWLREHGPYSTTKISEASDLFVAGDSSGGGLAVALGLNPSPAVRRVFRGVIGISSWLDMTASTPSYDTRRWMPERCFGDACNPDTDRQSGREEAEAYLGKGNLEKYGRDWRCSPFFAEQTKLKKMPPVLLQIGDYELLLDESVLLHRRMKEAGHSDATVRVYPRMWHCWHEYEEGSGIGLQLGKAHDALYEISKWVKARSDS